MPYKDKDKGKEYRKEYRKKNGKEIDAKRTKTLKERLEAMSPEDREIAIQKRRETCMKSYFKNRDKILAKNKERVVGYDLKWRYGITYDDYLVLLEKQNKKCAICKCDEYEKRWTSTKLPFAVDHCHESKEVRGLLCDNCNVMIGHAKNDTVILQNAINYLNGRQ